MHLILSVFDRVIGIYFVLLLRYACNHRTIYLQEVGATVISTFAIVKGRHQGTRVGSERIVLDVTMTRPPHLRLSLLRPGDISTDLLVEGFPEGLIDKNRGYHGHFCQWT